VIRKKTINSFEWEKEISSIANSTFFHTPQWFQIWKQYKGWDFRCDKIYLDDEKFVLFCYSIIKGRFISRYVSSPGGCYGGLLSNFIFSEEEAFELFSFIKSEYQNLIVRKNPFESLNSQIPDTYSDSTHVIFLDELKDEKDIIKDWNRRQKDYFKSALKKDITVTTASTEVEWKGYYQLYLKSITRWEKVRIKYPESLFSWISKLPPSQVKLWLAYEKEEIVSGCLCFYHNQHVVYWHGASDKQKWQTHASLLIHHEIIKDALKSGRKWYDLNPSAGLEGVKNFKKSLGARELPAGIFEQSSFLLRSLKVVSPLINFLNR
jgi:hypothetical protein